MNIRKPTVGDIAHLVRTLNCLSPVGDVPAALVVERFNTIMANRLNRMLVATNGDNSVVSTASIYAMQKLTHECGTVACLEDVATHPDYQGQGFARKVVGGLLEEADGMGCYKTVLCCKPALVPLYEHLGFEKAGIYMRRNRPQ